MLRFSQGFAINDDEQSGVAQENHNFANHFIR